MEKPIKIIAFYLPQFHSIPENDKWWGNGFTEWTNVRKAKPLFDGHHQPHVPTEELGYYDLRNPEIQTKQAQMAHEHGIYGFCYYHYWFGGKKLLETPLQQLLENKKTDFPFCVCWANENWTRRWDGQENEILIAQNHSDQDDLAFIKDLIPVFKDPRYIKINGKPLLVIYRTELFPDIKKTADIWRKALLEEGIGEIYLVRVEGISEPIDPQLIGFDAAIEFAPDWRNVGAVMNVEKDNGLEKSGLRFFDYELTMQNMLSKEKPEYKLFRGVFPSWDNTARRGKNGTVFCNSSPENFEYFLKRQMHNTVTNFKGDEKLLFLNAWNEWGEGCHLEPDEKYGKTYLEICKKLVGESGKTLMMDDALIKKIEKLEILVNKNGNASMIRDLQEELEFVKSSKFWKLRKIYLNIKSIIGR